MRVAGPGPHLRQRRSSATGVAALLLAAFCLVQLHLLVRSGRRTYATTASGTPSVEPGTRQLAAASATSSQQALGQRLGLARTPASPGEAAAAALARVRGARVAFVSFANGAFDDFLANWVLSVQRLGLPFVVGALDKEMVAMAAARGWPHIDVAAAAHGAPEFFRANFTAFRSMGATEVQLVLTMLEEMGVETVVVSDSDTAWLRDPTEFLDTKPAADWFHSTDCLSHETEAAWQPVHNQPRCGHITGNHWGRSFNTGIFAVRNRRAGRDVLRAWRDALLDSERTTYMVTEHASNEQRPIGITDQAAFNRLIDYVGSMPSTPEDPRLLLLVNGTLRLHPLPILLFPSGHAAFVQRLPWRHGVEPYVVHATFQRFPTPQQRPGKRSRFRETGIWFLDPPKYYAPPGGASYLTYDNDVRAVVAQVAQQRHGGAMPLLMKHMTAVSFQLALFRDALAAARMLNRTLVLPRSWCWCDYDWTPHVLERCTIRGSDLQLPFECPSDFIFTIPAMDEQQVDYRMPGFLEHPQVPERVRRWRGELQMRAQRPEAAQALPGGGGGNAAPSSGTREGGSLWPGMAEDDLLAAVQPVKQAAVLSISGMRPGLVAGFHAAAATAAFDGLWRALTSDHLYWCCASEKAEWSSFPYHVPRPLAEGYRPWEPPQLAAPKWCDAAMADERQREFAMYDNHPCQFLRNATAPRVAAALA